MKAHRPSCVLLLGARERLAEDAEAYAREKLEVRHVSRYARDAKALDPSVALTLAEPVDVLFNFLSPVFVPPRLLARPTLGAINFHPAPPRWPGVGSASFALYEGDSEFGATAHLMTEVMDAGPILLVERFPIRPEDGCDDLFDRALDATLVLFRRIVDLVATGHALTPTGDRWERAASRRRDFDDWLALTVTDPPDEVRRKVRAARSTKFPGPHLRFAGEIFSLPPAARRSTSRRASIPWWEPQMTGEELERIREVIDSNYLNDGDVTEQFERALAVRVGAKHAICTTSGTTALFLALVATGVRPGDEVIVPDLTFIACANAITLAGAVPVLVDVDPKTLCIDPVVTERAVTPRTRAIMPVHVSGRGAEMTALAEIAARHGLAIVEDAAEAFGSRKDGCMLGTIGQAGCLSFSPNKTITTGQGGAVLTDSDAVAQRLRELKDQGRPQRGTGGDDVHPTLGFNFKLTNLQAAVGLAQLGRLETRIARQRRIHELYVEGLDGVAGIELLPFDLASGELPQWTDVLVERRDDLDRHLTEQGMGCRRFWFPLHTQAPYRLPAERFPHAARVGPHALWLPSAFTLSDDDVRAVCTRIRAFLS